MRFLSTSKPIIMVFRVLVGSFLISSADALNWALLVSGSNTYNNYRHQADLCHSYQVLVSKGFSKDRIVVMAYDDIAGHEDNPFPGKMFNSPDPEGPGVDVYAGCNIDYKGDDVTAANFVGLLQGNGTVGGNGRTLDIGSDDDLTLLYFDHGAPGLIQFPTGDVLHSAEFQSTLQGMYNEKRYGRMVIYMESCNSGSMLEGLPADINIYGVTAVGPDFPSLGTYCKPQSDGVVNGTYVGSCLGDVFAVLWMKSVSEGDGSLTLNQFFQNVYEDVASYAALNYGHELNQQYGDLSMGELTVGDFFYGDSQLAASFSVPFHTPDEVFSVPRLSMDRRQFGYNEESARPLFRGVEGWRRMLKATQYLQDLLLQQRETQRVYWFLVESAYPTDEAQQYETWTTVSKPQNPQCELVVHRALVNYCAGKVDVTTAYSLQFHQVVVNLCNSKDLDWADKPDSGAGTARLACSSAGESDILVV